MLDPRLLRDDLAATVKQLARRGVAFDGEAFALLEKQRKTLQIATESLQKQRNENAKNIGKAKSSGEDIQPLLDKVQGDGNKLQQLQDELNAIAQQLSEMLATIPNILATEVPDGFDESCNKEIAKWGALPQHDFAAKDHVDLGAKLGLDFATAAKIASARFAVLKGDLATMHRALIQFMLDQHTACGYCEVYVPFLANAASLYGTGQLPKFADDLFQIAGNSDLYLIPTAEVPVTNIVRDTITPAADLPLKFVCHTPCFRSEAGAYGRDVRGMIRQHQFEKVELVQIVSPANSQAALACLTDDAINILQKLQLPYRKILLCAGDTGFSATKTYDLEVWLPGQKAYREISSCSNFGDFQARRMGARWRDPAANKPQLLHTINGSGLAVGRTLIAIMENYQDEHGNIAVPKALQPYMAGTTVLTANNQ